MTYRSAPIRAGLILVCAGWFSLAAKQTVTGNDGRKIILNDNFTWEYAAVPVKKIEKISFNKTAFVRPEAAKAQLKGKKVKYAIWYDAAVWKANKNVKHDDAEYMLQLVDGTGYALTIPEEISIETENLMQLVLENARQPDNDAVLISKEYRTVNGKKILHMIFDIRIYNIDMRFYAYLYNDANSTLQFMAYVPKSKIADHEAKVLSLLNGIEVFN